MKSFSVKFKTFEGWLSAQKNQGSKYVQRIAKAHAKYPNATLVELRGHGKEPLHGHKRTRLYQRKWDKLSSKQKLQREIALEVVDEARRFPNRAPKSIAKSKNIKFSEVIKATNAFHEENDRWIVDSTDNIDRLMHIYTDGKDKVAEINNSITASLIGRYFDAIRWYLYKGEQQRLIPFQDLYIKTANGKDYPLETDPLKIQEIEMAKEGPEFYTIYAN